MASAKGTRRTCPEGHSYYKSSDCPVCHVCAKKSKPDEGFLANFAAPARRALESNGIFTLKQLSEFTFEEVQAFHGMGIVALTKIIVLLNDAGLEFRT